MADTAIVFDLDGTLLDTAPDLIGALNDLLAEHGHAAMPVEAVHHLVGSGAIRMIERAFAFSGSPLPDGVSPELRQRYLNFYRQRMTDQTTTFPGLINALDRLSENRHRLSVCTNKQLCFALPILARLQLDKYFQAVVGGDSLPVMKPDPAPLRSAIRRSGGRREAAIMIGDSRTDVETARALGIPIVLVSFGYTDTPAAKLGGDAVIDHFDELNGALTWIRDR